MSRYSGNRCDSCKGEVFWRAHERTGNLAPLDAQPAANGNLVLGEGDTYRVLTKRELAAIEADPSLDTVPRYTSHFATCPRAAAYRR